MLEIRVLADKDPVTRRIDWVDNAKAVLIVLVVFGHFEALGSTAKTILYAFHLPAFLFLTGFMMASSISSMSTGDFFRKYVFPFARLYLIFSLISLMVWWASKVGAPDRFTLLFDAVASVLYGTQSPGHWFPHGNGPLWYLPFLICALIGFHIALRLSGWLRYVAVIVYFAFSITYAGPRLPWSSDSAGVGLFFIMAGFLLHQWLRSKPQLAGFSLSKPVFVLSGVVAAAGLVVLSLANGGSNINILMFGNNPLLYLAAAFLGIYAITVLCVLLPRSAVAYQLSLNSLVIFCIHIYGVKVLDRLPVLASPVAETILLLVLSFVLALACAGVSFVIMPWINRFVMRRPSAA